MANYSHLSDDQILALAEGNAAPAGGYSHLSDEEIMKLAKPSSLLDLTKNLLTSEYRPPFDIPTLPIDIGSAIGKGVRDLANLPHALSGKPEYYQLPKTQNLRETLDMQEAPIGNEFIGGLSEFIPTAMFGNALAPLKAATIPALMGRGVLEGGVAGASASAADPFITLLSGAAGLLSPLVSPVASKIAQGAKRGVNAISEKMLNSKPVFNIEETINPLSQRAMERIDARGASGAPMTPKELQERIALAEGKPVPSSELLNSDRLKKRQEFLTRIPFSGASKPYSQFESYLNTEKNKIIEDLSQKAAKKGTSQEALDSGLIQADEIAGKTGAPFNPENYLKAVDDIKNKFKGQLSKKTGKRVYKRMQEFLQDAPEDAPKNFIDSQDMRNTVNEIYQDAATSGDKKLLGALRKVNSGIDDDIAANAKKIDSQQGLGLSELLKERNARFKDDVALNELLGKKNPEELTLKDFVKNYQSVASQNKGQEAKSLFRETNEPLSKLLKESKLVPNITKSNYMKPPIKEHIMPLAAELGLMGGAYGAGHYFDSPVLGGTAAVGIPLLAMMRARNLNSPRFAKRYLAGLQGKELAAQQSALARLLTGSAIAEFNQ